MTAKKDTFYDCFLAALRWLLKKEGYGSQKKLADTLGMPPQHMNALVKRRQNRRASLEVQERIAAYFGLTLLGMCNMGAEVLDFGKPVLPPWQDWANVRVHGEPHSIERAVWLCEMAERDILTSGILKLLFGNMEQAVRAIPETEEYLSGAMSDAGLYEVLNHKFREIAKAKPRGLADQVKGKPTKQEDH